LFDHRNLPIATGELRQILVKLGRKEAATSSDHDLHASGVLLAGQRHGGAKLLHKALDRQHRVSISQFDKAKTAEEVGALWKTRCLTSHRCSTTTPKSER